MSTGQELTGADIKGLLPMGFNRTVLVDFNDYDTPAGTWVVNSSTLNHPPGAYKFGICKIEKTVLGSAVYIFYHYHTHGEAGIFERIVWGGQKTGWKKLLYETAQAT